MYPNPLRRKILDGELVLGTMLPAHDIRIAAALAYGCKADFIWLDQEHSPFGPRDMEMIPIMLRQQGIAPLVRVAWNDPGLIKKAYDGGAVSVMVPQVDNVEAARRAIDYASYPPVGKRGISPSWPALAGDRQKQCPSATGTRRVFCGHCRAVGQCDNRAHFYRHTPPCHTAIRHWGRAGCRSHWPLSTPMCGAAGILCR